MAKIHKSQFIQDLARAFQAGQDNEKYAGLPRGPLRGTVVDVNDPKKLGRICVIFDDMNPDCPQSYNGGKLSERREGEEPDRSHWIDVTPPFKGLQPKGLLGKRVNILPSNGQYNFSVAAETIFDPPTLAEEAAKKMEMPTTSTMTRLPVYEAGSLPPAQKENHGCMVVEMGGPMDSDWLCVCLQRQGQYYWVRHIDMAHGHAGENDGKQPSDSHPDAEQPVEEQAVWDYVFPTTGGEMQKYSRYGTKPRSNPFGGEAKWYDPPQ
jgi:hypothetical protein